MIQEIEDDDITETDFENFKLLGFFIDYLVSSPLPHVDGAGVHPRGDSLLCAGLHPAHGQRSLCSDSVLLVHWVNKCIDFIILVTCVEHLVIGSTACTAPC